MCIISVCLSFSSKLTGTGSFIAGLGLGLPANITKRLFNDADDDGKQPAKEL